MRLFAILLLLLSATVASAQQPNAPTGLTAVASAGKTVRLTWTAPSTTGDPTPPAPVGYFIYRALESGTFTRITTFGEVGPAVTTFLDDDPALVAGSSYSYQVRAFTGTSTAQNESEPSNTATATPADTPGAPGNLRATSITGNSITLAWDPVVGATSYTLYRDGEAIEEDIEGTTFQDTLLENSTTYVYNVTANSAGGESAKSANLSVTTYGDGSGKEAAWAKRFRQVDIDANGLLTLEEYLNGQFARQAKVIGIHRFEYMDADDSGDVSLTEYAKGLGGRKFFSPTRTRQFYLADRYFLAEGEEPDGFLDEFEFALTVNSKIKEPKLLNMLEKRDDNNSGDLSEVEFGIRNGSDLDSGPPLPGT